MADAIDRRGLVVITLAIAGVLFRNEILVLVSLFSSDISTAGSLDCFLFCLVGVGDISASCSFFLSFTVSEIVPDFLESPLLPGFFTFTFSVLVLGSFFSGSDFSPLISPFLADVAFVSFVDLESELGVAGDVLSESDRFSFLNGLSGGSLFVINH